MLFGKLPDDIFRPLSGPNRHIIEKVLKCLYTLFFTEDNPDSDAPRRDVVLNEIFQVLATEDTLFLKDEDGDAFTIYDTVPAAADYIYRRLVKTGWLDLEEEGYYTYVVPNPNARLLLEALIDIERREKKSYGLTVVSILSHIESAIQNPKERGIVFTDAVKQTQEFSSHLRGILYSLREVQEILSRIRNPREVLASYFDEFVENILIADYKTLNAADNPFRFRARINKLLRQIEHLDTTFEPIAESYQAYYGGDAEGARNRLRRDIDYISRVFKSVDSRLEKIDSFCFRLQRRVDETVRLMDRAMPGVSNRLADLLQVLGAQEPGELEEDFVPGPELASQTLLLSPLSIYSPHGKKIKPSPQVLRSKKINPEIKHRKELVRAFMKRRAFEPWRVTRYLDGQMGDRTVMSAGEFNVETIDELISFLLIRRLPQMWESRKTRTRAYTITSKSDMIETPWVRCRNFTVERR